MLANLAHPEADRFGFGLANDMMSLSGRMPMLNRQRRSESGQRYSPRVVSSISMCPCRILVQLSISNPAVETDVRGVLTYDHKSGDSMPTPRSMMWNTTNPACEGIDYSLLKPHPRSLLQPYSLSSEEPSLSLFLNYTFPLLTGSEGHTLINGEVYQVRDTAYLTLYTVKQDPTWVPPPTEQQTSR